MIEVAVHTDKKKSKDLHSVIHFTDNLRKNLSHALEDIAEITYQAQLDHILKRKKYTGGNFPERKGDYTHPPLLDTDEMFHGITILGGKDKKTITVEGEHSEAAFFTDEGTRYMEAFHWFGVGDAEEVLYSKYADKLIKRSGGNG